MPRIRNRSAECAPWQPQAAEVLEAYMRMRPFRSMRELEDITGIDRNKLGLIRNRRPGVSVNFWKRALTNFITLSLHGMCRSALPLLEEESRRMDQVKYSLTPEVKRYVAFATPRT